MPHDDAHRRRAYDRAHEAFDEMEAEEQARFFLETAFSAVSRGAGAVSRALADELEHFFHDARDTPHRHAPGRAASGNAASGRATADAPGPAEPPTDAQRGPA